MMMFLGLNVGIVTIYRRVALVYLQVAPQDPMAPVGETPLSSPQTMVVAREGNSQHLGGDLC
jgi:hypothetical protein